MNLCRTPPSLKYVSGAPGLSTGLIRVATTFVWDEKATFRDNQISPETSEQINSF